MLIYLKPPPVEFVYLETAKSREGEAVFRREGCLSCHELFGNGTSFGPPLDGVGGRRSRDWLETYLRAPRAGVGERPYRLRMPAYDRLDARDMDVLVEFLGRLRPVSAADPATR